MSDDTEGAPIPDALYDLLPPIFRMADIAQGYPLLALCKVFDHVREQIGDSVRELEDDWFIQTCPLDLVPYVAAQLGLVAHKPQQVVEKLVIGRVLRWEQALARGGQLVNERHKRRCLGCVRAKAGDLHGAFGAQLQALAL